MNARRIATLALTLAISLTAGSTAVQAKTYKVGEYKLPERNIDQLRQSLGRARSSRATRAGTWAPMRYELSNRDLKLMGLPPKRVLLKQRYRKPTAVYPSGRMIRMRTKPPSGRAAVAATAADRRTPPRRRSPRSRAPASSASARARSSC